MTSSGMRPERPSGVMAAELSDLTGRVLQFWFGLRDAASAPVQRPEWFRVDGAFDAACAKDFRDASARAAAGELDALAATAHGALALVLLLDQLPRNIHRGRPQAFAADGRARAVAAAAIDQNFDQAFVPVQRQFFYLPFEHSEDLADQERAVALFRALAEPELLQWAERHRNVIARFGRFPHRNAILGRQSSAEELAFLERPGSSF